MNGKDLEAAERDVATTIERVADGRIGEAALADWFRAHLRPLA